MAEQVTGKDLHARERDLLFGIILALSSIALGVYGNTISLKIIAIMDARYYTAAGFLIVIISVALFSMALYLIINARKCGATLAWMKPSLLRERFKNDHALQTFIVFFYLFLYMVVFWENIPFTRIRIPFWLNTMIFMDMLMITFKSAKIRTIIIISAITSCSIHYVFEYLIGIPLP